jgi:hypothetical protein
MSAQRNESNSYGQTLNSYDPLIWRKDINVIARKSPEPIVLESGNVENPEKIIKHFLNNKGMFI